MSQPASHMPAFAGRDRHSLLTIGPVQLMGLTYGATATLFISLGGQLYINELMALFTVLFVAGPLRIVRRTPALWWVAVGYGLVLLGLVIADVTQAIPMEQALRGWANIIFAFIDTLFVTHLLWRRLDAILWILAGLALSQILNPYDFEGLAESNYFKAAIVPILTPLLLILVVWSERTRMALGVLLLIALAYVGLGARSAGLIFLMGSVLLLVRRIPMRQAQRPVAIMLMIVPLYLAYVAYVDYTLASGGSGNAYDQLVRADNPYNPLSLLAEGRAEFRVALYALQDSWLIGRGSWAQDTTGEFAIYQADLVGARQVYYNPIIASHSVVLTAWLWGGITALAGMVLIMTAVLRQGVVALASGPPWRTLVAYYLAFFSWHVMFSPVGHLRTSFPLVIALCFVVAGRVRGTRRDRIH